MFAQIEDIHWRLADLYQRELFIEPPELLPLAFKELGTPQKNYRWLQRAATAK